jgi:hypothetical protein
MKYQRLLVSTFPLALPNTSLAAFTPPVANPTTSPVNRETKTFAAFAGASVQF